LFIEEKGLSMANLLIGIIVGILIGAAALLYQWRVYEKIRESLTTSRSKLERQRTQAVNELFALRSDLENNNVSGVYPVVNAEPALDPKVNAEVANLKNLVVRADAALAVARRKRNEYEEEINRLRAQLGQKDAEVINLHQPTRPAVGG